MLSVILGYSQLLERTFTDTDFYKESEYISSIINASEKAKLLTSKLLSFSKKEIKKLEVFELSKCVQETLVTYGSIISEDIFVDFQTIESGFIQADRTQIDQVILNLLVNSRDAMLDNIQRAKKLIEIDISYEDSVYNQEKSSIILTLKDNGCGIQRADLEHIFEPFYSTKKDLGTGLGLSTVHNIVKQQGGDISVTSQLGKGTTFRISWPQVTNPALHKTNTQEPLHTTFTKSLQANQQHIYLVEDEQGVRNLVKALLSESGYQVSVFDNGNSLLEYLENTPPAPALLITDLILTNQLNGKQIAEQFSAFYPDVPVLYVSGYSHELISKRGIVLDNVNFLRKPFEISTLIDTVNHLINR
jgi:CheY-like chemotaxis protein